MKIALILALATTSLISGLVKSDFLISKQESYGNPCSAILGSRPMLPVPDGGVHFRSRDSSHPGDYYRFPQGAETTSLTPDEFSEISNGLRSFIDSSYYDSYVVSNLTGFSYEMAGGKVKRREYHVRYVKGDTTYVISGWLGKFLSFYKVVPGNIKYTVDELQQEGRKISPAFVRAGQEHFRKIIDEWKYFIEYIDKERLIRIRTYIIEEVTSQPSEYGSGSLKPLSLIEITKFLDPEVIP